jgi:SNF2 family DNA or RNA helicase
MSLSVCVGSIKQRLASLSSSAQVVVTNYDNLQWLAKQTLDFDAVVFDELTRLKNPSGARFKALHKVLDCPIRWGLTGSFTSNGLEDVFGQCKIVDQSLLGRSKGAFQQQYFVLINKEYGEWAPRVGSLEKVMAVIKPATFVLEAGDYTLPSLNIVPVMCAMDLTHYNKMKKDFVVEFPTAKAVALNAGVVTGKLQQMASGFVYDANSSIWFSSHKFDRLDELLAENQRANTIIAYTYQEELAELKRRYPKAQTLDDTKAIERWNAGKIEMLLVHPKSAGHGLNLQHGGCNMVFLSLPWSLELYEQTIGRLHRSGQKNAVWVYVMTTLKTVDERIYAALQDKRAISDIAMEELK